MTKIAQFLRAVAVLVTYFWCMCSHNYFLYFSFAVACYSSLKTVITSKNTDSDRTQQPMLQNRGRRLIRNWILTPLNLRWNVCIDENRSNYNVLQCWNIYPYLNATNRSYGNNSYLWRISLTSLTSNSPTSRDSTVKGQIRPDKNYNSIWQRLVPWYHLVLFTKICTSSVPMRRPN